MNKGVASDTIGDFAPAYKTTWTYSFKWKPPEHNTIDFLVTTKKTQSGNNEINNLFATGLNLTGESQLTQYQVIIYTNVNFAIFGLQAGSISIWF